MSRAGKDFKFVADAVQKHVPNDHKNLQLMADAAPAIRNGLSDSVGEIDVTAALEDTLSVSESIIIIVTSSC